MNENDTIVDKHGEEEKKPRSSSASPSSVVVPSQQLQLQQQRWVCDSAICHTQDITSIEVLACADTVEDIVPKNRMSRYIKSRFETESLLEGAAEDSEDDDDDDEVTLNTYEHTLNTYNSTLNTTAYITHASDQDNLACGMILNGDGTLEVPTIPPVPSGAVADTHADDDENIVLQGDSIVYRNATNDFAATNTTKIAIASTLSSILPATAAHRSSSPVFAHRSGSKEQHQDKESSSLDATFDTAVNTTMESAASLTFAPWIGSDGDTDSDAGNDHHGNQQPTTERNRSNDTNTDNNTSFTRKTVNTEGTTDDEEKQTNGHYGNRKGYRGSGAIARETSIEVIGRGVKKEKENEKKKHATFLSLQFWKTNHRGEGKNSSKNDNSNNKNNNNNNKGYCPEEETTADDVNLMKEKRYREMRSALAVAVAASAKKSDTKKNNIRSIDKKGAIAALWKKTVKGANNSLRTSKPMQ